MFIGINYIGDVEPDTDLLFFHWSIQILYFKGQRDSSAKATLNTSNVTRIGFFPNSRDKKFKGNNYNWNISIILQYWVIANEILS